MNNPTVQRPEILKERFSKTFGHLFDDPRWLEGERRGLLDTVGFRLLEPGDVLMRPGAVCHQLPMVISGSIRVYKVAENGREISLYRIQAGQSCMLSTACGSGPLSFPATAVAELPTAAAFLPDTTVSRLMSTSQAFTTWLIGQYAQRTMEIMELVEEVAFQHVDKRLHEFLLAHPEAGERDVHVTHRELADHIGTSREVVSRILKDWEERGALSIGRGSISLKDTFKDLHF